TFNTTKLTNGQHTLKAIAYNNAGNSAQNVVTVTVNNVDIPTVSIASPANGATVSGTITITANATDPIGSIAHVDFYVDSTFLVSDTAAPYMATLDTTRLSNGQHMLKAYAYNAAGTS